MFNRIIIAATYNWLHRPKNSVKKLKVKGYYSTSAKNLEALVTWESSPGRFLVSWSPRPPCSAANSNSTYQAVIQVTSLANITNDLLNF